MEASTVRRFVRPPAIGGRRQLIYILAASHSGSTLLAMLLGAHPSAATVGELKITALDDPERYLCSCGQRIRACGFWRSVREAMAVRGVDFAVERARTDVQRAESAYARRLLRPLHRGPVLEAVRDAALWLSPAWRRALADIQHRNGALVDAVLELTGARVLVDSSKVGLRLKYLLRNDELDVRVVRQIRDGRAVALTYVDPARFADAKDRGARGGGVGGDRSAERKSIADAAREWRRSNEEAEEVLRAVPADRRTEVRYEELCLEPRATLERVCEAVGLDKALVRLDFRGREHHVIGNGMRLDRTDDIALDERWRTELSAQSLAVFDAVAGELNRRYGYGDGGRRAR